MLVGLRGAQEMGQWDRGECSGRLPCDLTGFPEACVCGFFVFLYQRGDSFRSFLVFGFAVSLRKTAWPSGPWHRSVFSHSGEGDLYIQDGCFQADVVGREVKCLPVQLWSRYLQGRTFLATSLFHLHLCHMPNGAPACTVA